MKQGQEQAEEEEQEGETEGELAYAFGVLDAYFEGVPLSKLVTTTRQFPGHMRVDVQAALDKLLAPHVDLFGLAEEHYETLSFARLLRDEEAEFLIGQDDRRLVEFRIGHTLQRILKQRPVADELNELLRGGSAR